MAAGDIVNIHMTGVYPAGTTYQPAAGVEIIILSMMLNTANTTVGFTDGANYAKNIFSQVAAGSTSNASYQSGEPFKQKFGITNAQYLKNDSGATNKGFSGIQIK